MKEKITNQKLFVFLEKHGAWEKFLRNHDREWMATESINSREATVPSILMNAFSWERSSEGHDYWEQLYRKAKK